MVDGDVSLQSFERRPEVGVLEMAQMGFPKRTGLPKSSLGVRPRLPHYAQKGRERDSTADLSTSLVTPPAQRPTTSGLGPSLALLLTRFTAEIPFTVAVAKSLYSLSLLSPIHSRPRCQVPRRPPHQLSPHSSLS
jgi:hypothetical protein